MLADLVALVLFLALATYTVTGGADFGGGVWDLLATGPRKDAQRDTIARAIGPIWEANHVWLILIVVVLFVSLPKAFGAIATALHIPLVLMLIGIVLRGAAFVFRAYDPIDGAGRRRWRRAFAIASAVTPVFLGVVLGAIAAGGLRIDPATGHPTVGFFVAWIAPYPFLVGAFTLALFAYLAAVYLTVEADDDALREDFRRRALISAVVVGALALATLIGALTWAPRLADGLTGRWWSIPLHLLTGAAAIGAMVLIARRRFRIARIVAIAQTGLIILGLAASQYPFVVAPDLTFERALAPPAVVVPMLVVLAAGAPLLVWALALLYKVFKSRPDPRDPT